MAVHLCEDVTPFRGESLSAVRTLGLTRGLTGSPPGLGG
jgi:hypothetical protein